MKKKYAMLIDLEVCSGCHACSVACKAEHRSPIGSFRHKVQTIESGEFPHTSRLFAPTLCQHCEDAPCLDACGARAIERTEDGVVKIDDNRCVGSGDCVAACPYGAIYFHPETQQAEKCDFCLDRIQAGEQPACAATCPTDAIVFGREDDPQIVEEYQRGRYTRWNGEETKPRVWYKGLTTEWEKKMAKINRKEEN